jgi:hypothetical protein
MSSTMQYSMYLHHLFIEKVASGPTQVQRGECKYVTTHSSRPPTASDLVAVGDDDASSSFLFRYPRQKSMTPYNQSADAQWATATGEPAMVVEELLVSVTL